VLLDWVEPEYAVCQRVPVVVVEEQPAVDALFAQGLLHLS
jgi:hypothetical protein